MFLLAICALLSPSPQATEPSLIGWWRFEEGSGRIVKDFSGKGNDGTIKGKPWWVKGKFGWTLVLDGRTHVNCGTKIPQKPLTELTVELWFQDLGTREASWVEWAKKFVWSGLVSCRNFQLFFDPFPRIRLWVFPEGEKDRRVAISWNGKGLVDDGEWHYIAATFSGEEGVARLVVDGEVKQERRVRWKRLAAKGGDFLVGGGGAAGLVGALDEVRVYARALSPEELRRHAHIEREVIVAGRFSYIEVWSAVVWEFYSKKQVSPELVQESLEKFSLRWPFGAGLGSNIGVREDEEGEALPPPRPGRRRGEPPEAGEGRDLR